MKPITGLVAATFTPLSADGRINLRQVEKHAALLIEGRVAGAFVNGSTGESLSLSVAERQQLTERWCQVAPPSLPVIVHVGHHSLPEAETLAAHAQQAGAAAIAAMAPGFFAPESAADLVSWCAAVAAAAPDLPFYFYHIPSRTHVSVPMSEFLPLATWRIPSFAGIKYTHYDLMEFRECVTWDGGHLNVLFGCDEILLSALALGCQGAIGSTYNYLAPVYHAIVREHGSGNLAEARRLQDQAMEFVRIIKSFGALPSLKAVMKWQGVDCGPVRPPLPELSADQQRRLKRRLRELPIFTRPLR